MEAACVTTGKGNGRREPDETRKTKKTSTLGTVELLVNDSRNGLDLRAKLLFNLVHVESVLESDEVDGETQMTKATRTTDTMEVGLSALGEVKVDDDVDGLDVDTTSDEVGAHEVAAGATAEVVENAITMVLLHLSVDVEARAAQLANLLGKKLHTVHRIAEDNGLSNVQLLE